MGGTLRQATREPADFRGDQHIAWPLHALGAHLTRSSTDATAALATQALGFSVPTDGRCAAAGAGAP